MINFQFSFILFICYSSLFIFLLAQSVVVDFQQSVDLSSESISVHCIRVSTTHQHKKADVLLLHGAKYSSKTWESTGILTRLSENGYNVVAIDLPGYGGTESLKYDHQHHVILEKIIASLSLDRPVIISPSFSGLYSIDYILRNPKGLLAFIPIAPVFPENFGNLSSESLDTIACVQSIPAFVVWGSKDSPGKKRSRHLLTIFKKGISFEIEGASHPCYLDEPDMFSRAVTSYLNNEVMIARAGTVVANEI